MCGAPRGKQQPVVEEKQPEEVKPVVAEDEWQCPQCTYVNKKRNRKCEMCGAASPLKDPSPRRESRRTEPDDPKKSKNSWKCGTCTYHNSKNKRACEICNQKRPEKGATVEDKKFVLNSWICGDCGSFNGVWDRKCNICEADQPEVNDDVRQYLPEPHYARDEKDERRGRKKSSDQQRPRQNERERSSRREEHSKPKESSHTMPQRDFSREARERTASRTGDISSSMPEVKQGGWECSLCHYKNAPGRPGCEMCSASPPTEQELSRIRVQAGVQRQSGVQQEYPVDVGYWRCGKCRKQSKMGLLQCTYCMQPKPEKNYTISERRQIELAEEYLQTNAMKKDQTEASIATGDYFVLAIRNGQMMPCPECKALLQKDDGCDWVECPICKTEVCWAIKDRRWGPNGHGDESGGCRCGVNGEKCVPHCNNCH